MTSRFKKVLSALLALTLVASPIGASLAEDVELLQQEEIVEVSESAPEIRVEPESEPEVEPEIEAEPEPEPEPEHEQLVPEDEAQTEGEGEDAEAPEAQLPEADEQAEPAGDEAAPQEQHPVVAEPSYAVRLDASSVVSPVYVPFGAEEGELPLPSSLPAEFSDGSTGDVAVLWFCTGNTFNGQGYIPECEDRGVVFYFQATPVGIDCSPSMILPAVTVMYAPQSQEGVDHEGIRFAGTDMLIAQGSTVTTDDIRNENGYDPSYRIVCEGIIEAGEDEAPLPNPVLLRGAIRGGVYDGEIELARGTIRGGTFNARVLSARGTIHGGTFVAGIGGSEGQIYVTIDGGEFPGDVGDSADAGYVFIRGGAFYGDVRARELIIEGDPTFYNADGEAGERRTVTVGADGVIEGGAFYANVLNRNNIAGGSFYGKVTNGGAGESASVLGGEFHGEFENARGGKIYSYGDAQTGARFLEGASLSNSGEIDAGEAVTFCAEMRVVNEADGVIASGTFPCEVVNRGTILGGSFDGGLVNAGNIYGGSCAGELYNEGGTVAGAEMIGMLMFNSGMVTLDGIVVDPAAKTATIASGKRATTDDILTAIGSDTAAYVIHNEGTITGGQRELPYDFAPDSIGEITGGSFSGKVFASAITGGSFSGPVKANSVSDGSFADRVIVRDNITGGSFGADSVVTAGVIAAGTFDGRITSAEREKLGYITITGGTFNGGVATVAGDGIVINGGTFNGPVGYCSDASRNAFDGYVSIRAKSGVPAPEFNGEYVGGYNVIVECGVFSEGTKVVMNSVGDLAGGVYYGPVYCNNAITGGEFHGEVTMNPSPRSQNGQIHGGTFYGTVNNRENSFINEKGYGGNPPPKFLGGEIINEGEMNPGTGAEFASDVQIVNQPSGRIASGVYRGPVTNLGAITGGAFYAPVKTYSPISGAALMSAVVNVPDDTIEIPEGERMSIAEIQALDGYTQSAKIINRGAIYAGGAETLPNDIENRGTIESGSFTGAIKLVGMENNKLLENGGGRIKGGTFSGAIYSYYGVISGGTFNGKILTEGQTLVVTITGGTFHETVGEPYNGYVFVYRADGKTTKYGAGHTLDSSGAVFYKRVAARNLNITCGTFNGPVEVSTVGIIENGLFKGPVTSHNIIAGGEFYEVVSVCSGQNSHIEGGLFHKGTKIESGTAIQPASSANGSAIAFDGGEIANSGTMDPGAGASFGAGVTIQNAEGGNIKSGVYHGPVINLGTMSNVTLYGNVQNEGRIVNSIVNGKLTGKGTVSQEGVELDSKTITIQSGYKITTDQLAGLMGDSQSEFTVLNKGEITGGSATLGCTVKGGAIRGGHFTGAVYAFAIYDGIFDANVYVKVINGGTFNGSVRDFNKSSAAGITIDGMTYTGGLSVNGGSFKGTLGGQSRDDAIFIHGGDFASCQGLNVWNLTIDASLTGSVTFGCPVDFTVGSIDGGTFTNTVTNRNNIKGGVFNGKVINYDVIASGTFNGGIENHSCVKGMDSYKYSVGAQGPDGKWVVETRTEPLGGTLLNCEVTNVDGGWVESSVTWGSNKRPSGAGPTYVQAFVGNVDGTYRIYNGHEFQYGQSVKTSLASLDAAQSTKSTWTYLDGDPIGDGATISLDPMQNLFLRESSFNIQNGVLELDGGWSSEGGEPSANFTSVHIPAGATVSAGDWTHPVINDGTITGGSFVNITNRGTIRNAGIKGNITAEKGTIEGCNFGASAKVVSIGTGASIRVSFTAAGETHSGQYGANVLDALNAVRKPDSGYQWYNIDAARVVSSSDTFGLNACSYEIRSMPAPEIIWPVDAAMAINCKLSTASFTDRDPNGSFAWANPNTIVKSAGKQYYDMIFTPDAGSRYNYAEMQVRKSVPVQVSERIITVRVNSATKLFGDPDPDFSCSITGLDSSKGESINRLFRREAGNNVGTYEITADVRSCPAGCTVQVIPGTLTIEPRPLNAAVITITEGSKKYYPADRYTKSYTGAAIAPSIQVSFIAKALVEGTDYRLSYRDNTEPGTAYIDIAGIGNYSGQAYRMFYISAGRATLNIESCSKEYGDPDPEFHATLSGVADPSLVRYELYRLPGENVGTYSILKRNVSGPFELDIKGGILTIQPKQLPSDISAPEPQTYTGAAITPKVAVRANGRELTEGVDYTLSYENNVKAGNASVIVTGKGNYAGTQRVTFVIQPAKAEIAAVSTTKNLEEPDPRFTANVTGAKGADKLNYTFKREEGEELGEYAINVIPGDNPNYEITTVPGVLTILPVVTRITLTPDRLELDEGAREALRYEFYPDVATAEVRYASADQSVATVDGSGNVLAVQAGETTITATTDNGKTAVCEVAVRPVAKELVLANGESAKLTVEKRKVTSYASNNDEIATVDNKGSVTAHKVGSVEIMAKAGSVEVGKWTLEVTPAPTKVILSQESADLGVGQTIQLSATTDEGSNEIEWSSSKASVASVDASGRVTASKAGSAVITAKSYNGKTASCKVTVTKAPTSVKLSVKTAKLGVGDRLPVTITVGGGKSELDCVSTNPGIAIIEDEKIVGVGVGTATITVSTYNGKSASCTVTVAPQPTSVSLGEDVQLGEKQSLTLPVQLEPRGAYATLSFSSSNSNVVSVDDKGTVKGAKGGSATITVRTHNGLEASVNVSVKGKPTGVKLSAKKASIGAGQTYQLSAEALGAECEIEWSSGKKSVATVDENGLVTALKAGTAKITAKTYNNKKATCTITVTKAPTSIKLNLTSVALGAGEQSEKLKVTLSKKTSSSIRYSFDREGIAEYDEQSGRIVAIAPGTAVLTASTYNGLSATCAVTVLAKPKTIDLGEDQSLKVKKSLTLSPKFGEGEGGSVTYATSNKKIATVDASGKVKAKKAGTVTITATTYNGVSDTVTITVTKK